MMAWQKGGCHCGAVRFEAEVSLDQLATCNCSICGRTGAIMAFVPSDKARLLQGEDHMTDYVFGKKTTHHPFCKVCGVRCLGNGPGQDGKLWSMVNVRCLDGVDVHELEVKTKYDGKSF
jgi:hypothetical protein